MIKKPGYFLVWLLCALIALCAVSATVSAENDIQLSLDTLIDPFHNGMKYSPVIYTNTNGLPASEANAIAHTG